MKGLILKEWYVFWEYFRIYFVLIAIFTVCVIGSGNIMMMGFPAILVSFASGTTVASVDEKENWLKYSMCLPYKRSQIVSVKYILTATVNIIMLILTAVLFVINGFIRGFTTDIGYLATMCAVIAFSGMWAGIVNIFNFKFGVEKARIVHMISGVVMGVFAGVGSSLFFDGECDIVQNVGLIPASVALIASAVFVAAFAVAWRIAIKVFEGKEV